MDKTHFFGVCQEGHSHAPFAAIFRRLSRGNFVLSGRTARSRRGARHTMDKTHFFGVCQEGHSHAPFAAIFRRLSRGNFVLSGRTARSRRGARCTGRFGRRACDRHSRALPLLCRERSAHPLGRGVGGGKMVRSGLLIRSGAVSVVGKWCVPLIRRVYGLPGEAAGPLVLGLTGGYPIGAQAARELYDAGTLSREESERLLGFCNNTGPAFLIGVCGAGLCGSVRTGVLLYGIHIAAALLTGLAMTVRESPQTMRHTSRAPEPLPFSTCLTRTGVLLYGIHIAAALLTGLAMTVRESPQTMRHTSRAPEPLPFSTCLTQSVQQAGRACLSITAFIMLFSMLRRVLEAAGILEHAAVLCTPLLWFLGSVQQAGRACLSITAFIMLFSMLRRVLEAAGILEHAAVLCTPLLWFLGAPADAAQPLLVITAFIMLFSMLRRVLEAAGILEHAAVLCTPLLWFLGAPADAAQPLLVGILEMTSGLVLLPEGAGRALLPAMSFVVGFGGLSVLCQTAAAVNGLSLRRLFYGKVLHGLIAAALTMIVQAMLPHPTPVFSAELASLPAHPAAGLLFVSISILCVTSSGKKHRNRL